ncbi:Scr1 family TA system antitoxin-like transcriptional regulator [Streptomyces sp. NPDC057555]|uniref:helix-turn-helix domain-containing protein n=1 Tax=Streptomyces sp. NPDC057555 TaxID=3346166 RepID=UPI0036A01B55
MSDQRDVDEIDPRRHFGEECRSARELHDPHELTQAQLAKKVRFSTSTISRVETGEGNIPSDLPARLDEVFATDGLFKRLYDDVLKSAFSTYAQRRIELEEKAVEIAHWSFSVIPGLLQTKGYARALMRAGDPRASDAEPSRGVTNRLARQSVLISGAYPDFSVVLCESVIRRRVGTAEVMREQLGTLLVHAKRPTTRIQVLPLGAEAHGLMDGPLNLLTLPSGAVIAYVEGIMSGAIIDEPSSVRRLARAYDGVTASALSAEQSAALISQRMEEL